MKGCYLGKVLLLYLKLLLRIILQKDEFQQMFLCLFYLQIVREGRDRRSKRGRGEGMKSLRRSFVGAAPFGALLMSINQSIFSSQSRLKNCNVKIQKLGRASSLYGPSIKKIDFYKIFVNLCIEKQFDEDGREK